MNTRAWIDGEGAVDVVTQTGRKTKVLRRGHRHGAVACELTDTGNGFIARFPARNCTEQDAYACLDYSQARDLVLALTPHARELGFEQP